MRLILAILALSLIAYLSLKANSEPQWQEKRPISEEFIDFFN